MDFSSLLGLAQEKQSNKVDIKRYSTQVSGPKKATPKEKKLSENVRRFMERKDAEERSKKKADSQRTKALLEKRSMDKKSMNTMKSMLQRTKSANKAVLADTGTKSVSGGRKQCDEDDYGYESGTAHNLYDKLMKKYEANKEDPEEKMNRIMKTPKEIRSTLNRVKSALHEPEEVVKHRRRSRSKPSGSAPSSTSPSEPAHPAPNPLSGFKVPKKDPKAIRLSNASKGPPPTSSFTDLIKMAEAKATGDPNKSLAAKLGGGPKASSNKEFEFHRPMTNKMKEEFKREYLSNLRKSGKLPMNRGPLTGSKPSAEPSKAPKKVEEAAPKKNMDKPDAKTAKKPSEKTSVKAPDKRDINSVQAREFPGERKRPAPSRPPPPAPQRHSGYSSHGSSSSYGGRVPKQGNRIESESDSDEDSEMDDFIDDSGANVDISAQIRGIFGYDRRKYRDEEDFDDRSMVANYSTIMKEEIRSAKIGKQEDEEELRREEEEEAMRRKRKKRR